MPQRGGYVTFPLRYTGQHLPLESAWFVVPVDARPRTALASKVPIDEWPRTFTDYLQMSVTGSPYRTYTDSESKTGLRRDDACNLAGSLQKQQGRSTCNLHGSCRLRQHLQTWADPPFTWHWRSCPEHALSSMAPHWLQARDAWSRGHESWKSTKLGSFAGSFPIEFLASRPVAFFRCPAVD